MKAEVRLAIILLLSITHKIEMSENDNPVVNIKLGKIKGSLMTTRLGKTIYSFRGIYYAEPPTGQNRFKPPIRRKPWTETFDARKEGPACTQEKGTSLSENCLTLNIYTKEITRSKILPVIVYIHSGAFLKGSGQSFLYGPRYLLDHDIVLVTINYRLASLGFLNTGDEYAPGNMALKDQVLALKFVRDHIIAFGGDPNSVTLAGQSAGSRSIVLHFVSPMSQGLFHRAIAMSGSMTTPIPPQQEQLELVKKVAYLLNCTTETTEKMVQCLRETPDQEFGDIIPLFEEWYGNPTIIWYPSVEPKTLKDERFLTGEPEKLMQSGKIVDVPLIIGVTMDEYSFKVADAIENARNGNDSYFQDLANNWYELAPLCFQYERNSERSKYISRKLYEFYFSNQTISVETSDILRRLFANAIVHWPVHRAATLLSKHMVAPVYFYEFTYPGQYSRYTWKNTETPSSGVAHGDDLQYIFNMETDIHNSTAGFPLYKETDPQNVMVERLTGIWAHFAKTGKPLPNDSGIYDNVTWERLTADHKSYLDIGKNLSLRSDFLGEAMKFWDSLFPEKHIANSLP